MSGHDYDVAVIGGGINGVGVAQAAAAAGHSVVLIEKQGLAAGTSSKSSMLIHGGLRYLESYEFGLVRESLRERALLLELAPDLVQLQSFLIPIYRNTRRSPLLLRTGLSLYYLLSGMNAAARFSGVPRLQWDGLNGLRTDNLRAVFRYTDARTDDALLTEAVMRSAQKLGAELLCPAAFTRAEVHDEGCELHYRTGEWERSCSARVLVNAAGPWINRVAAKIEPRIERISVELVQGTHIAVPGSLGDDFFYLESPRDGRAVFIMPRDGHLLIGTTETRYRENPDHVRPLPGEESYLLGVLRHYFPEFTNINRSNLISSWAGLRVLPGGPGHAFHRSRETILQPDRRNRPRVLGIYGGKLTTYRATAEKVIERIAPSLPSRKPVADTARLQLSLG
ncbi:MAG: FAD-dependent oxidoreductase [Gammaproteobacteria bacterium]|jgi:glycerol-3-phosphate dehydrogenase|nr:FAD-dependent oxidoreductase [Gammaproteobacteria bacterium]MDP6617769.1 FAD-dependent oxidoreductase [Gammaproteobacteria bacterium]MDP6694155.1 FAD-dependent oxidoreductase [Gammaproteobacteria bacterium]